MGDRVRRIRLANVGRQDGDLRPRRGLNNLPDSSKPLSSNGRDFALQGAGDVFGCARLALRAVTKVDCALTERSPLFASIDGEGTGLGEDGWHRARLDEPAQQRVPCFLSLADLEVRDGSLRVAVDPIRDSGGIDHPKSSEIVPRRLPTAAQSEEDYTTAGIRYGNEVLDHFAPGLVRRDIKRFLEFDLSGLSLRRECLGK